MDDPTVDPYLMMRGHRRSAFFNNRAKTDPKEKDGKCSLGPSCTLGGSAPEHNEDSFEEPATQPAFLDSCSRGLGPEQRESELMHRIARRMSQVKDLEDQEPVPDFTNTTENSMKARGAMNLDTLMQLKAAFEKVDVENSGDLTEEEFVQAFKSVRALQSQPKEQLAHLFMKIDATSTGTVDWDEFTNHILLEQERLSATEDGTSADMGDVYLADDTPEVQIKPPRYNTASDDKDKTSRFLQQQASDRRSATSTGGIMHNDMIDKIINVPSVGAYVTAGRDGFLVVWQADTMQAKKQIRNGSAWITDMSYMPNQPLAVCSIDRTITFYDTQKSSRHPYGFEPLARINNLDNVPMSAKWVRQTEFDMLLFGDDRGNINSYKFEDVWGGAQASAGSMGIEMGNKKLPGMKQYLPFKLHTDWVTKLMYQSNSGTLITSSMDSTLRMVDLERKKTKWTVNDHMRGVYSFDCSRMYNFIASCGVERHIMLWNPFTGRSVGALYGHTASVQEILVNESENQLISLATDKVIKIWDLRSNKCLQTLLDGATYWPENRISAIAHDPRRRVIITGTTKAKVWHRSVKETVGVCPVVKAAYNKAFRQVVAGDLNGNINVWSVDRGESVFNFNEAHGEAKLSAMAFDQSLRRLLTCARDGSVNMWNFNNGKCLKVFEDFGSTEISCATYVEEGSNHFVIAAGDDRKVVVWVDNKNSTRETVYATLDGHYDDITSVAFCHQSILATGSYDGKIILWKICSDSTPKGELVPPDDHMKTSEQKPIEQLQFLPNRGKTLAALTMDAKVYVWRIVDGMHMHTLHTEHKGQGTAMHSDEENNYLITADSLGFVFVWDLTGYEWRRQETSSEVKDVRTVSKPMGRAGGKVPFMHGWQAHRKPVKSVQHVKYKDKDDFVVTASEDGRVRFWTLEGQLVGTFGVDSWFAGVPESYVCDRPYHKTKPDPPSKDDQADQLASSTRRNRESTMGRFPERAEKGEDNEDSDFVHSEDEAGGEEEEDAEKDLMSQEMYDKLILEQRRHQLLEGAGKKKKGSGGDKSTNVFNTILDRRLKLQVIAPVEAPRHSHKKATKR